MENNSSSTLISTYRKIKSSLFSGLSQVVATISPPEDIADDTPVEVTNLKALGSYNWIENEIPTIAIPGQPAVWKDRPVPFYLRDDLGAPFFDENIARKCGFPLEPDLLAIEISQAADASFDLSNEKIDIVTNRNNLRKLISFANPEARIGGRTSDSFRIDAQLALNGRTMVLTRFEKPMYGRQGPNRQQNNFPQQNNHRQQYNGWQHNNNRQQKTQYIGYDHIFERMCTEELPTIRATDSRGRNIPLRPVGYNRIVRYDLLGMRFLVRSRVDGMLPKPARPLSDPASKPDIDDLVAALERARLEPAEVKTTTPLIQSWGSGVRYVKFGEHIPQDLLLDLKLGPEGRVDWYELWATASLSKLTGRYIGRDNAYPQYFLSQTPNLRIATRTITRGPKSVTQLQTYDRDSLRAEHENQSQRFRNLVSVLKQMRQILQTHGSSTQPLAFVWNRSGYILVYKIEETSQYLSDKGLDKF